MKKYILYLFVFLASFSFSQKNVIVVLKLTDKGNGDAVRNAKVSVNNNDSTFQLVSNVLGEVKFQSENGQPLMISISHYKYENIKSIERKISLKNHSDTVIYSFRMKYLKEQQLDAVIASAPGVPQVVYGSEQLHVSDFELLGNDDLLLLTYPKRLKKGSQLLVYDGLKVKNTFEIPDNGEELIHDYRGNPHVVCENNVYGIHVSDDEIGFSVAEKKYYMKYIAPIVDTNKTKMYFSNFNKDYPAFEYYSFDNVDSTYTEILKIKDDLMMELYRSEYKWVDVRTKLWAKNKEIQTGIDAEIWVGANYFTQSLYYKELYAPMFQRNDSLFVFDYYKDQLRVFNQLGEQIDSVEIYHHYNKRKTGWKKNLIQDKATGQIYALFDRAGWTFLGRINTKTGEIREQIKLEYRYVHDVAIRANQVYYIYRPYESAQKKFLYKERLPY